ncbi:hypothetical protein C1H46_016910 [Malus baccata]|uniref:Uncharacterized protein n=1 Tax=Malus baccata TaxID=106549 RepID=A0A540MGJ0_MALBA|nr:hypothetical protein C1H46_016910 [Malus baccata]
MVECVCMKHHGLGFDGWCSAAINLNSNNPKQQANYAPNEVFLNTSVFIFSHLVL